jgi:hypothetical protein
MNFGRLLEIPMTIVCSRVWPEANSRSAADSTPPPLHRLATLVNMAEKATLLSSSACVNAAAATALGSCCLHRQVPGAAGAQRAR